MIFWVISKGSNVWNQDEVAGRSLSNPAEVRFLQPESYTACDASSSRIDSTTFQQSWTN